MITNVLFATTILFLAVLLFLLQECSFLIPYRTLLLEKYAGAVALFCCCSVSQRLRRNVCSRAQTVPQKHRLQARTY